MRTLFAISSLAVFGLFLDTAPAAAQTAGQTSTDLCYADSATSDQTITSCTKLIQSGTLSGRGLAIVYYNRGIGYEQGSQYDLAIADYSQALSLDPNYRDAYNNRGNVYQDKGQHDLAIADYNQALRIDPTFSKAYNNRGRSYRYEGQYDRAIADTTQSLQIDPNYRSAYINRGLVYICVGRYADAGQDLAHALSLRGNDTYTVLWLHIARLRAGVPDGAEYATNAAALPTGDWPGPIVALYGGGTTAAAALAGATSNDQRCEAYYYVGEWQAGQHHADLARSLFQQAVSTCQTTFPESSLARAELQRP
jgi:lipoprotein NlpI